MNQQTNGHPTATALRGTTGRHRFEFRLDADPFWLSPVRSLVTNLALRAEFDLDTAADLTMAVDEAVALLINIAGRAEVVTGHVELTDGQIRVCVSLPARPQRPRLVSTDTFAWRVLSTLADRVELIPDGRGDTAGSLGIQLVKARS